MNEINVSYLHQLDEMKIKLGKAIRKRIDFNYDLIISQINGVVFDLEKFTRVCLNEVDLSKEEKQEIESEVFELLELIKQSREAVEYLYQLQSLTCEKVITSEAAI